MSDNIFNLDSIKLFDEAQGTFIFDTEFRNPCAEVILPQASMLFPSPNFVVDWNYQPMTFTASDTSGSVFRVPAAVPSREEELLAEIEELEDALEDVTQNLVDAEKVLDEIDEVFEVAGIARSDLFLLEQRRRMEEKGWKLAFLSPSVVELLEQKSVSDFTESDIPFYYDVDNSDEE